MKRSKERTHSVRIAERAYRALKIKSAKEGKTVLRLISELVGTV